MSKSNNFEAEVLDAAFLRLIPAWLAANANFFLALHTADPGETGDQTANEASYPGYVRIAVPRDGTTFVRTLSTVSNIITLQFPMATGGPQTITHWSLGLSPSGAGDIKYKGALDASLTVNNLIVPLFLSGTLQTSED